MDLIFHTQELIQTLQMMKFKIDMNIFNKVTRDL